MRRKVVLAGHRSTTATISRTIAPSLGHSAEDSHVAQSDTEKQTPLTALPPQLFFFLTLLQAVEKACNITKSAAILTLSPLIALPRLRDHQKLGRRRPDILSHHKARSFDPSSFPRKMKKVKKPRKAQSCLAGMGTLGRSTQAMNQTFRRSACDTKSIMFRREGSYAERFTAFISSRVVEYNEKLSNLI